RLEEMTLMTIAQARELADDVVVMSIRGKLKTLYKQDENKPDDSREWTRQNGVIADKTGEIKFAIWNQAEFPVAQWKGREIEIRSVKGTKGGWHGVSKTTNEYLGKSSPQLSITGAAEIIDCAGELKQEPQKIEPPQQPPPERNSHSLASGSQVPQQGNASTPSNGTPQGDPVREASARLIKGRDGMIQIVNCQLKAIELWNTYGRDYVQGLGVDLDPIALQTLVNATVIQMERERWHLLFPTTKFKVKGVSNTPLSPPPPLTDVPVAGGAVEEDNIPF